MVLLYLKFLQCQQNRQKRIYKPRVKRKEMKKIVSLLRKDGVKADRKTPNKTNKTKGDSKLAEVKVSSKNLKNYS